MQTYISFLFFRLQSHDYRTMDAARCIGAANIVDLFYAHKG